MNSFDYGILSELSRWNQQYPLFARIVLFVYTDELKNLLIGALIWYAWFSAEEREDGTLVRERIAAVLVASVLCVAGVRIVSALLPFRVRPLVNPEIGLFFPFVPGPWGKWSSFPSDNAVMFSMIATGLFVVSRPLGLIAALDVALLICFPRVIVGVHHPTDILAGMIVGVAAGWWVSKSSLRTNLAAPLLVILRHNRPAFYACAFVFTFLLGHVFWPVTQIVMGVKELMFGPPATSVPVSAATLPLATNKTDPAR